MQFLQRYVEKHRERVVGLDLLRSIAILLVVAVHAASYIPNFKDESADRYFPSTMDGVSIFFVLSGFLIGGILLRTIRDTEFTWRDLLNFWIRRWFRTIPNYLFVLCILLAYQLVILKDLGDFNLKYLFFSQNLYSPHPNFYPEAWSLTVEEWFYLTFPIVCFVAYRGMKNKQQSVLLSALVFLIFPLVMRIVRFHTGIAPLDWDLEIRKVVVYRLDALMYGVLGAYIQAVFPHGWLRYRTQLLVLTVLVAIFTVINPNGWREFYPPVFFNIESLLALGALPFLSNWKTTGRTAFDASLIFVSIISYSMYLLNLSVVQFHAIPILQGLLRRAGIDISNIWVLNYSLFWLFTIAGSYLLYRFFEHPMTKLRDSGWVKALKR